MGQSDEDLAIWRVTGDPLLAGAGSGPLRGVRVAVKDLFAVAGERIGAGVPAYLADAAPRPESAAAVTALLAAGASVSGIAQTEELAYGLTGTNPHYGTPPNPAAPDRVSGGSTSGPASAVALGEVDLGLGTDTAGSIRVPASYQGLVGVRTSHGVVDRAGLLPLAPSFDTVGWLTRDAELAADVARVLVPPARRTPIELTRTIRLSALDPLLDSDVRADVDRAVARLIDADRLPKVADAGIDGPELESWFHAFRAVQGREAWAAHGGWIAARPDALGPEVAARFAAARAVTGDEAAEAEAVAAAARVRLRAELAGAVLLLPAAATRALSRTADPGVVERARDRTLRLTVLAGLAGAPAVSVPVPTTAGRPPVGLCLVGPPGTDCALVDLAGAVLACLQGRTS